MPAIALAATFPAAWMVASRPKAEPRIAAGASAATAECWAVSTQPIAMPAATNGNARMARFASVVAKGCVAGGVDDGRCGEQPGEDGQADRPPHAERRDQAQREQRTEDRAEVVHHAFEAEGAAVGSWSDDVGEQGVAGGYPQSAGGPGGGAQDADLPHGGGGAGQRGQGCGRCVAADGDAASPGRIVGESSADEACG